MAEFSTHIHQHFKNSKRVHHSVVQLAEEGHAPLYPVLLWLVCGQLHAHHKVSGVSGGGESSSPVAGLVEGDGVGGTLGDVVPLARLQPHLWDKYYPISIR